MKKIILFLVFVIASAIGYSQNTDRVKEITKMVDQFYEGETKAKLPILESYLSEKNLPDYVYALVAIVLNQYYVNQGIDKFDIQSVNKLVDQYVKSHIVFDGKEIFDINLAVFSIASDLNRQEKNYPKQVDYLIILKQVYEKQKKDSALVDTDYIIVLETLSKAYYILNMPDMGIEYGEKALVLSNKFMIKTDENRIYIPYFLARNYVLKENYQKAFELFNQVTLVAKEIYGDNTLKYTSITHTLAQDYSTLGEYAKAIELNQQNSIIRKEILGDRHIDYFFSVNNLAMNYYNSGNYQKSIDLYEDFIPKSKEVLGEQDSNYLTILSNLAQNYTSVGKYINAVELFEQIVTIKKEVLGDHNPDYFLSANSLALNYYNSGNYQKSIDLYEDFIPKAKEILGEQDPNYLTFLSNLVLNFSALGEYAKAIEFNEQIVTIRKAVLGDHNEDYILSVNNLAQNYFTLRDFQKSMDLYLEVMPIAKEVLGDHHPLYLKLIINLALNYSSVGKNIEAKSLYEQTVLIQKEVLGDHHPDYLIGMSLLASNYYYTGDYEKSINIYKELISNTKDVLGEHNHTYLSILKNFAGTNYYVGDFQNAKSLYEEGIPLVKDLLGERHPDFLNFQGGLALSLTALGDCQKAADIYNSLVPIAKEVFGVNHLDYLTILNNRALNYHSLGNYLESKKQNEEILSILKDNKGENSNYYLSTLGNLAENYNSLGEYQKAKDLNEKIVSIRKEVSGDRHPDYLLSYNNLLMSYISLGDNIKAINSYLEIMPIILEVLGDDHPNYMLCLNNLAMAYDNIGESDKAIKIYQEIVDLQKSKFGVNNSQYLTYLNNLALGYSNLGDYQKAKELYIENTSIALEYLGVNHRLYLMPLSSLAQVYFWLSDYDKSEYLNKQVVLITKNNLGPNHPDYLLSLSNLAGNEFFLNQNDSALIHYQEVLKVKKVRVIDYFSSMTEHQREMFWNQSSSEFEYYPLFLEKTQTIHPDAVGDGYDAALFSKGLLLNTTLDFDKLIAENGTPEAIAKFEELKLLKLQGQRLLEKPIAERFLNVDSLENIAQQKETELVKLSKEYGDYTSNMKINWKDVQSNLGEKDVAIEFVEYPTLTDTVKYAAMVLRKGWQYPKMISLFRKDQIEEFIKQDKDQIYSNGYIGKQLKKLIWSPLEEVISEGDKVYFSASGVIHQLAIENLPANDTQTLSDLYHMYRLSSTKELAVKKPEKKNNSAALYGGLVYDISQEKMLSESKRYEKKENLYAMRGYQNGTTVRKGWNYLEGTLSEVEQIDRMMKDKKYQISLYTGESGNEESFKSLSGKKEGIIHIATHGFFLPVEDTRKNLFMQQRMGDQTEGKATADPMLRSGLMFSGGNRAWQGEKVTEEIEDGVLTAKEISRMDLRGTDMVVLSACETGLGDVSSEGVFGLQRSFKQAGVQTLVMSLWEVSDKATNYMMTEFYSNLLKGKEKREAFLEAKKSCKGKFPEPQYWAAFILLD